MGGVTMGGVTAGRVGGGSGLAVGISNLIASRAAPSETKGAGGGGATRLLAGTIFVSAADEAGAGRLAEPASTPVPVVDFSGSIAGMTADAGDEAENCTG